MPAIVLARFPDDKPLVQVLFREYQATLGIDLEFQSFAGELAGLPGKYAPPRGNIALASVNSDTAGCVCWYPFSDTICEIKRLYVRPHSRGLGVGRQLLAYTIDEARKSGYAKVRLDSLERLKEAEKLYESFDFRRITAYNVNPFPDVYYMELDLNTKPEAA